MSLDVQSCGSTLISAGQHRPSPSPQMAQRARAKGGEAVTSIPSPSSISTTSSSSYSSTSSASSFFPPMLSPNPSGGKASQKTRRGKVPLDSIPFVLSSSSSSSSLSSSSLTNVSSSSSVEYEGDNHQEEPNGSLNSKSKSRHQLLKRSEAKKLKQTSRTLSPQVNSPCPRLSDPRRQLCMVPHPTSLRHPRTSQNDLEGTHTGPDSNSVSRDALKHRHHHQQRPIKLHPDKKSPASAIALRQETPKHEGRETKEGKERDEGVKRNGQRETEFQKTYSPTSPQNTISKTDCRNGKTENDNDADDDEGDKRTADRETRRRHDAAASLASRDTGNFAPPPESSWESKRSPTSRKALRELRYSNNIPRCQRPLPSPSPSCPPSGEDRQGPHSTQYHSLPQLYLGSQDLSQSQQQVERNNRFDASASKPYYMSDLYRTSIPGISRNRRYSQTSLIDQALENLELSSLADPECELPVTSHDYLQRTNQRHEPNWVSSSRRSSTIATSPVLPPLPAGVLDRVSPEPKKTRSTSPEDQTNLASVCILSFDLTLDCEELSNNGFDVVNITNNSLDEIVLEGHKSIKNRIDSSPSCEDNIRELDDEDTFEVAEEYLMEEIECVDCEKEDTVSNRSLSLSIDDKYFENDNYDNVEDIPCDFISEEEQEQLDHNVTLLPEKQENDMSEKIYEKGIAIEEVEDFIEIDCDVKPMETLKRPLVYGYGNGPVRSMKNKPFIAKRFSLASDYSEYMEMNTVESLCKQDASEEVRKKSESCMNLRETYWDYWQAKRGIKGPVGTYSSPESSNNCSSKGSSCPSDRFCYDPEVLLAHVRCPKSLEDATFRQYSACVKSHIHDYFGNVQEALNEYGLSMPHQNWISSQPNLLPDSPKHAQMSNIPLDYSSEPELPTGSEGDPSYRIPPHQFPKRVPPRPLPNTLQKRDLSQDSGTWTYLQSSHESALDVSAVGAYPVPLPRSTSSLSHIVPNTYNPWQHLLSDVTPPRTPRHSIYSTAKGIDKELVSHSASPSPSRRAQSSTKVTCESNMSAMASHHAPISTQSATLTQIPQKSSPGTHNKRSFFPSLSKVVKSPLKRQNQRQKTIEKESSIDVLSKLPVIHPSIQKRTHTATSSKSSSSSSSSSSASSKDSVTTVIPASAWNKGPNWLMKHFGGARSKMAAV